MKTYSPNLNPEFAIAFGIRQKIVRSFRPKNCLHTTTSMCTLFWTKILCAFSSLFVKSIANSGLKNSISIFVISFLFITGAALAADPGLAPQQIFDNMQAQESKINDLQFNLRQVIALKGIKEQQVIKGTIIYKKPDLLHVEYAAPTQQLVIANKDDLVMYIMEQGKWQESMRQKVSNLIGKQWKSEYGLWSVSDMAKNYDAQASKEGNLAVLTMVPKDKTYLFKMKIYVNTTNWMPVKTTWEDDNQLITSELLNIKMNTGVKDELFKFK